MPFALRSPAFQPHRRIPRLYTADGENLSPPMAWFGPPTGTRSFALIVEDHDAPAGGVLHWGVCNITCGQRSLPEGVGRGTKIEDLRCGINDFGHCCYDGPAPPKANVRHRYVFRIFALDQEKLSLPPKPSVADIAAAAQRHILAEASLVCTYARANDMRPAKSPRHGLLGMPRNAEGLVIFPDRGGHDRRDLGGRVAAGLRNCGLATLLVDLLTPAEQHHWANYFNIALLSARLAAVTEQARRLPDLSHLPIGYFASKAGAAAALVAAARDKDIAAVVSRSGRPDLAFDTLPEVQAATLLIVGAADLTAERLNRCAFHRLQCEKELVIVPGGKPVPQPGTLDDISDDNATVAHAEQWFLRYLSPNHPVP